METIKTQIEVIKKPITEILIPIHDRVVVMRDTPLQWTASGFEIPGSFLRKPNTGKILNVGARCSSELKPSMHVMFGRGSGTEITINDVTMVIMRTEDIMLQTDPFMMFGDRVLIKASQAPKMLGSIYVPDTVEESPETGVVHAAGILCDEVSAGAYVMFGKYAGMRVIVHGEEFICVRQVDVIANLGSLD